MSRPSPLVKIVIRIALSLVFVTSAMLPANAAETNSLVAMLKTEDPHHTRIVLRLASPPQYSMEHSGQRIDLLLTDTQLGAQLRKLPEDETVVKILLGKTHSGLMVSILLRRAPVQVLAESSSSPAGINLDLYWEKNGSSRPSVAFRIADMPPRKAGLAASSFQLSSPWASDWRRFYKDYYSDWDIRIPVSISLPVLPRLLTDANHPLSALQTYADKGLYLSLLQHVSRLQGIDDEEQQYLRELFVAEAQLRTGAQSSALARLEALRRQERSAYRDRVEYLTACAQALEGQPIVSQLTLQESLSSGTLQDPLRPFQQLLYAETALLAGQEQAALQHLDEEGLRWPEALLELASLRRADALAGGADPAAALATYQDLADETELLNRHLFSCNRAAFTAFKNKKYDLAKSFYRKLAELAEGKPNYDLVLFSAGMAAYESGDLEWGVIGLERALLEWPGTEGAQRAHLRLLDHQVMHGGDLALAQAVPEYGEIARQATARAIREEAFVKQALGHYLLGEKEVSVRELMTFRRDFHNSALRREAEQLLVQQLPDVVHRLLEEKNDLAAVVLVEQNRNLLLSSTLERGFLEDLATAFSRLGLYERAARVLLFLFDQVVDTKKQENLYLPLATSYLKRGEYKKADEYASRYLESYPHGEDAGAVFSLLLDALEQQGRDDEIIAWLNRRDRPSGKGLEIRAAWTYWRLGKFVEVAASLEKAQQDGDALTVKEMALLAEADFQLGQNAAAEKNYRPLLDDPEYAAQACYRTAQLLLRRDQIRPAVDLLKRVISEQGQSMWAKLAQDLLIQIKP